MNKISIMGMGALGILYGSLISDNCGSRCVNYIMDDARYEKYSGRSIAVNGRPMEFHITRSSEATPADLLIVAVKANGLQSAIRDMKNAVGENTIIISVLNGITSEQMIGDVYGYDNIVYCVAQGMDAAKYGDTLNYTVSGELRIGIPQAAGGQKGAKPKQAAALSRLKKFFDEAGISYTEEEDIVRRLWSKFMLNVGINQTCMVYGTTFGGALQKGTEANRTLIAAMREVIPIAQAEGIALSEADIDQYIKILGTLSPEGLPSMAQDRTKEQPSEVESFAGTVIQYAEKHGIDVPENRFLYRRIKEIEAGYGV